MRPGTRYNWVAISLVGLLLLAAAIPYIERQLGGMTGLKTPVAEFQFAGEGRVESPDLEKDLQINVLTNLETLQFVTFSNYFIKMDLKYLDLFPKDESTKHREIYQTSLLFTETILGPLGRCSLKAHKNYLDIESIRHALHPIAHKLYLLIQQGGSIRERQSKSSTPAKKPDGPKEAKKSLRAKFFEEANKSLEALNQAFVKRENKCKSLDPESSLNPDSLLKKYPQLDRDFLLKPRFLKDLVNPKALANAPHIYLALAYLDAFNHNVDRTIFLLEELASQRFSNHAPVVSFNINYSHALFLDQEGKYDRKKVFLYLDTALDIAQKAWSKIKDRGPDSEDYHLLEQQEIYAKNSLAYVSAREGIRKFEALRYAKNNYDHRTKLYVQDQPLLIDTYGYVKMAFEARKNNPNSDEIAEARALFKEAISHQEVIYEKNLIDLNKNASTMKVLRAHLEQANKLLKYSDI